ncbi:MAG: 3-hydroxyacyl-ACP dehydratase [Bacteroidota bacterium]
MLSGIFFNIDTVTLSELSGNQLQISALVLLNPSHQIFQGHFPGNPVVPGVCQIQMIKELIEQGIKKTIRLTESDNIKFLLMINPLEIPRLKFDILIKKLSEKQFTATATISYESSLFLKFKGKFEDVPDIALSKI